MDWLIHSVSIPSNLDELKAVLLENRRVADVDSFFHPPHPSTLSLNDVGIDEASIEAAVHRLQLAIERKEDILIFGDYDADGVCASTIAWKTLQHLGARVRPFIPHRDKHGYGITIAALTDIFAEKKPDLVVTVDNGIVAHEAIAYLRQQGVDVILTDHHQPEDALPPATHIVHTTQLCGTTVSWMLCRELLAAQNERDVVNEYLDLCAIATIADQVPLLEANRSFAWHGLVALRTTANPGLRALLKAADILGKPITSSTVGFVIAPRLNAMGRLAHALDALRLLCTTSSKTATQLASLLAQTNVERQDLTQSLLEEAVAQAQRQAEERVLFVYSNQFHEGVIGLLAGRLAEQFHKPAMVVSVGERTAKASARSVPGVNIVELIRLVRHDLLTVGGHPMAAGFGMEVSKLEAVGMQLHQLAQVHIDSALLQPTLSIECQLPFALCTPKTIHMIDSFAPFGAANSRPLFAFHSLTILAVQTMGREHEHLKLVVGQPESADPGVAAQTIEVVAWRQSSKAAELKAGQVVSLAGSLELNEWNNRAKVQMVMRDIELVSDL